MDALENTFSYERALVYGIGDGGDVVDTIPTTKFLKDHGVEVTSAG